VLISAIAINDGQQILANACDPTGRFCYSTVRLNPIPAIPEPAGMAMLLAGSALLGLRRFRRRRCSQLHGTRTNCAIDGTPVESMMNSM